MSRSCDLAGLLVEERLWVVETLLTSILRHKGG